MNRPLVTIGIPTYNRADGYLREALADALAQTYEPLEIVVSDNASTDATPERVRALDDERVRYVRHDTNIGGNANFDACLDHARGAYFLLLHDDDRIDPDFVATCMDAVARADGSTPPGLVRTGTRVIDAEGTVVSERRNDAPSGSAAELMLAWFARRTSMYFCSTLYRTDALREAGGFSSPHGLYIDVIAAVRIAAEHPTVDVPDVKASFRRHGGNSGGVRAIEAWCEDSLFLLDVACAAAGDRADELRAVGMRYFTTNNYSRVARLSGAAVRARAYWTVYRTFGFRTSPIRYAAVRRLRRWRQSWRGASV
jgi:glycosyltransferase involved in cell wall biosynthesis